MPDVEQEQCRLEQLICSVSELPRALSDNTKSGWRQTAERGDGLSRRSGLATPRDAEGTGLPDWCCARTVSSGAASAVLEGGGRRRPVWEFDLSLARGVSQQEEEDEAQNTNPIAGIGLARGACRVVSQVQLEGVLGKAAELDESEACIWNMKLPVFAPRALLVGE